MPESWKPTREQIAQAYGKRVPDLIVPDLTILFCGINPSLYSAAVKRHFARPGNRFWPTLHAAGLTERVLSPFEEHELLAMGYGITNIVSRATATAEELSTKELIRGAKLLRTKVLRFKPRVIAFLGISAFRTAFGQKRAVIGQQGKPIGETGVWVLPNPSGLNAHYQLQGLAQAYAALKGDVEHE